MKKTALTLILVLALLFSALLIFQVQAENWSTPIPILYIEKTVSPMSAFRDGAISCLSMSDDGGKIVFSVRVNGTWEIFVVNWDGTELKQLTNDSRQNVWPSISGNGSKITFYSYMAKERVTKSGYVYAEELSDWRVFVVNSDGTGLKQISGDTGFGGSSCSSITDDGSRIAFLEGKQVCIIKPDGTGLEKLTAPMVSVEASSISGDGSKIVFIGEMVMNNLELFVVNSDGTNLTQITDGTGQGNGCAPSISGDGKKIVFRSAYDAESILISFYDNQTELWSKPTSIITVSNTYLFSPCVTADGKKIFFSAMDKYGQDSDRVFAVNSDGTELTEIHRGPVGSLTIDGKGSKIAFIDHANNGIFVCVDLDTGLNAPAPATPPPTTPSPSTSPVPSTTPEHTPTPTATPTLKPSHEPASSPDIQNSEPIPEMIVIASTGAFSVAVFGVGLLVYFKKRKH